ncbi:MAG: rRNA maturation RNase YbeY, partial [Bacteroidota bacterium]
MENEINFHSESVDFQLTNADQLRQWIIATVTAEANQLAVVNFIFCSDQYLHKINLDYLQHDTYTDIITFPYSDQPVEGDVFISVERVRENAKTYKVSFEQELHRVVIHGVLHLLGYLDKTKAEKEKMTA